MVNTSDQGYEKWRFWKGKEWMFHGILETIGSTNQLQMAGMQEQRDVFDESVRPSCTLLTSALLLSRLLVTSWVTDMGWTSRWNSRAPCTTSWNAQLTLSCWHPMPHSRSSTMTNLCAKRPLMMLLKLTAIYPESFWGKQQQEFQIRSTFNYKLRGEHFFAPAAHAIFIGIF